MRAWIPQKAKPLSEIRKGRERKASERPKPVKAPKVAVKSKVELETTKKSALLKYCLELGMEVPNGLTKAEIVDLILERQERANEV